jgi:hypothetical protein
MRISLEQSLWMSGTDVLKVYEVYADVTNADSSVTHIVPTVQSYLGDQSAADPNSIGLKVTAASGDGTTVTYTYTRTSGVAAIIVGNYVSVSGFTTAGFNVRNAQVLTVGPTTFTIANTTTGSETISVNNNGRSSDGTYYGTVENVANSVDSDSGTYATFTRFRYYPGAQGGGAFYTFG